MISSKDNRSSSQIRRLPLFFSIRVLLLVLVFAGTVLSTSARAQKPKIAVFSGPTATIQNSQALEITREGGWFGLNSQAGGGVS